MAIDIMAFLKVDPNPYRQICPFQDDETNEGPRSPEPHRSGDPTVLSNSSGASIPEPRL